MLFIGSIKDMAPEKYDEIWVIVRSLGSVKTGGNVYHVPQLSPSWELFQDYLSWKRQGLWNKKMFDKEYTTRFMTEMRQQTQLLEVLRKKCVYQDILLVCFCEDESMCHRSLVRRLVMNQYFCLLVAGSRNFNDYDLLKSKLDYLLMNNQGNRHIIIVSGGAKGADSLAEKYAKEKGYDTRIFPAEWDKYGKSAGYRRNEQMHQFLTNYENRGCVCFWDGQSKGTQHNFGLCEKNNTPLRVIRF